MVDKHEQSGAQVDDKGGDMLRSKYMDYNPQTGRAETVLLPIEAFNFAEGAVHAIRKIRQSVSGMGDADMTPDLIAQLDAMEAEQLRVARLAIASPLNAGAKIGPNPQSLIRKYEAMTGTEFLFNPDFIENGAVPAKE